MARASWVGQAVLACPRSYSSSGPSCAALAARKFPAGEIHAGREEARVVFARLDTEQVQKSGLPLADQRFGHDQQDAFRALRAALGDHQAGLDRLSQPDLVRQNAPAFAETPQHKDHSVNLVGLGSMRACRWAAA